MLAQIATLFTQLFITTRIIKKLGVCWILTIPPLVTVAGFAILAICPDYGIMAIFQALHRATRCTISLSSRETLYSAVPTDQKYKAKLAVDVFLYRAGDAAGMGINGALTAAGLTLRRLAAAAIPFAGMWGALSIPLEKVQSQKMKGEDTQVHESNDLKAPV